MIRIFANAKYDFLRVRKYAYVASLLIALPGAAAFLNRGLNESIEFTGGTLIHVRLAGAQVGTGDIRAALTERNLPNAEIQSFGAAGEFVIRARLDPRAEVTDETTQQTAAAVDSAFADRFSPNGYTILRTEAIGPKVGAELRQKVFLAILMSFGATLIYLWLRFEWRFGIAAVAATAHDIGLSLAFLSLLNLEVSLVIVAAVLTIVGYSLNDTIVVFDRVRENLRRYKRANIYDVLNRSVNETLPRTLLTGVTTLLATVALVIFGGKVIQGFAIMMTFGIIIGTFSSIYIASPVLLAIERRWPGEDVRGAKSLAPQSATVAT